MGECMPMLFDSCPNIIYVIITITAHITYHLEMYMHIYMYTRVARQALNMLLQ